MWRLFSSFFSFVAVRSLLRPQELLGLQLGSGRSHVLAMVGDETVCPTVLNKACCQYESTDSKPQVLYKTPGGRGWGKGKARGEEAQKTGFLRGQEILGTEVGVGERPGEKRPRKRGCWDDRRSRGQGLGRRKGPRRRGLESAVVGMTGDPEAGS